MLTIRTQVALILALLLLTPSFGRDFGIGRLKYSGGGDWYANPTSIPNWLRLLRSRLGMKIKSSESVVNLRDESTWQVPLIYATGHGNINFTDLEADTLRRYLLSGGFLWVDDNFGMDTYFRRNIRKVFPEKKLSPLSSSHEIYQSFYKLKGLPKIHEHEGDPAQGFAMFHEGRMILFYSYSSDIGDGLEDYPVHKDPPQVRNLAEKFAVNLVYYVLN
ncbi:DUF4159 domain-containing protein [bacterium]|jgi:hypothetical protein|nr:DUF4159 domain-containing protein [bacterium]